MNGFHANNFGAGNQPSNGQNIGNIFPSQSFQGQNGMNMQGQCINPIDQMFGLNPSPQQMIFGGFGQFGMNPFWPQGQIFPQFNTPDPFNQLGMINIPPNQIFPPMNQVPSTNQPITPKFNGFNIIFRSCSTDGQPMPPITVQCMQDDKILSLINKYRIKANDYDETKKFVFNGKRLDPNLSVAEAGILDNGHIFVVTTKGIKGAKN